MFFKLSVVKSISYFGTFHLLLNLRLRVFVAINTRLENEGVWVLMHYTDTLAQFHFSVTAEALAESCVLMVQYVGMARSSPSSLANLLEPNHKNGLALSCLVTLPESSLREGYRVLFSSDFILDF